MEYLINAISHGFDDLGWILNDDSLATLRNREEYYKLVEDVKNSLSSNSANLEL